VIRQKLENFTPKSDKLFGIYRGVVEDRSGDPLKLGRIKIRVFGIHTDKKIKDRLSGVATEDLPWAEPAAPLMGGSSGFGSFSVPLQGAHVFLFFENGNQTQPRYFATAPGVPTEKCDPKKGFNDPDGVYPRPDRINEPDTHRLSRNEKIDQTIVKHKNDNTDKNVPTSTPSETWSEPNSAYKASYPNNMVMTTETGITIEVDSTSGQERIHIYHPSNSYLEIDNQGNMIFRNAKNRYEITDVDRKAHIMSNNSDTVGTDNKRKVGNNEVIDIGTDRTVTIGNDETIQIGGNLKINVNGTVDIIAGGNIKVKGPRIDLNP
jgi:hypothetical protein